MWRGPLPASGLQVVSPSPLFDCMQAEWLYKGTLDCFAKVAKEEGMTALFKGAGANALRTVGAAMVLVFYSEITRAMGLNLAVSE